MSLDQSHSRYGRRDTLPISDADAAMLLAGAPAPLVILVPGIVIEEDDVGSDAVVASGPPGI